MKVETTVNKTLDDAVVIDDADTDTGADPGPVDGDSGGTGPGDKPATGRRWRGPLVLTIIAVLVIALGVTTWKAISYRDDYRSLSTTNADADRAREVASDYAVKAALIDYRNFDPWFTNLKTGVDQAMSQQFATSEPALRDLLGQLQWVSEGTLVGSDITSRSGDTYVVQVFVDVTVSNVQSPAGVKTTALYPITLDKKRDWLITDISGGVTPVPPNAPR